MNRRVGSWLRGDTWKSVLGETRRFLNTWVIMVSESGFIYIRPQRRSLSHRMFCELLARLRLMADSKLKNTIALDFLGVSPHPRARSRIQGSLSRFARSVDASVLELGICEGCKRLILVYPQSRIPGESSRVFPRTPRDQGKIYDCDVLAS